MRWKHLLRMDGLLTAKAMAKIPVHIIANNKENDRAGVNLPVAVTLELPLPPMEEEEPNAEEDVEETCISFDMVEEGESSV